MGCSSKLMTARPGHLLEGSEDLGWVLTNLYFSEGCFYFNGQKPQVAKGMMNISEEVTVMSCL